MALKSGKTIVAAACLFVAVAGVDTAWSQEGNTTVNRDEQTKPRQRPSDRSWTKETKIGQIVADCPQTARIFELVGIDYCCGGRASLGKAAEEKKLDADKLLSALAVAGKTVPDKQQRDWRNAELPELMEHIVKRHHGWTRRELPSLLETTKTVYRVHGDKHAELKRVLEIVQRFQDVVLPHLNDEEQQVFPAVRKLASGAVAPANTNTLLEAMRADHELLGAQLHELRELTHGFAVPEGACAKYRAMLTGLEALESDVHTHVHLENNVLLPRALAMINKAKSNTQD